MFAASPQPGVPGGMGAPQRMPTSKIELSLSAKDLKDRDLISKSDPFAVLFIKNQNQWVRLGETESIKDNLNPSWAKQFVVDYYFQEQQLLKVEVYDKDSDSKQLKKQDFIGGVEFTLGQIVGSPGQSASLLLTRKEKKGKHQGALLVRAEEVKKSTESVVFRFHASGLANMDGLFSKSDPFLVIKRQHSDQSWVTVHKTEVIDNNLNPKWKPFELPIQKLCNGDYKRSILLEVNDEDSGGRFVLIGSVVTTMEEILAKMGTNFVLHNEKLRKKKGKKYTNAGLLVAAEARVYRPHTFMDYLRGGLEMNLIVAIDYTASNGHPSDPRSLHMISPHQMNQYQWAISATGSILQDYDTDKMFPVYGFGGIPPGQPKVNHCFPLNLNPSNPEVQGIHGVMQLYSSSLGHIALSGPTLFAPLIHQATQIASGFAEPGKQKYFVLQILTDGAIMDMQQTIDAIVHASHVAPLSIVIIGVGPCDFSSMNALDGDGKLLRASNGRVAARDIVQFVPFLRYAANPPVLAQETLAEIPFQLYQFMKVRGINPNPPMQPTYQQVATAEPEPSKAEQGSAPPAEAIPMATPVPGPGPSGAAPPAPSAAAPQGHAPPHGQGPSQAHGAPPQVHGGPAHAYGAPQGYGAPPQGYGAPQGYPAQGHGAPPQGYGAPPHGYGAPPQGFGGPQAYGAPPQGFGAPQAYGAPPRGFGGPQAYGAPPAAAPGYPGASSSRHAAPGYPGYRG